jgi:hypothetical protein
LILSTLRLQRGLKHVGDKKCDPLRIHGDTSRHHLLEPFPAPQQLEVDLADLFEDPATVTIVVEPLRDVVVIVHWDVLHQGTFPGSTDGKVELRPMPTTRGALAAGLSTALVALDERAPKHLLLGWELTQKGCPPATQPGDGLLV